MANEAGVGCTGGQGQAGRTGSARAAARPKRPSELLGRRREELGLSLNDVASRLGISPYVYATWERTPVKDLDDDALTAVMGALEMDAVQRARLRHLAGERYSADADRAPLRPSGPVPPSAPVRRPAPARPPGPLHPPVPVHPPVPAPPSRPEEPADPATQAYLRDYAALMDAVPLPSVLFDRRWDVAHTNPAFDALFRGVGPHPTAMPHQNFLRFVLFHPDAPRVLAEHDTSWCLPLMAQLAGLLEGEPDEVLQAVRDDIALDPIMDAAYRCGLPLWMSAVGAEAIHHDGAVRPVHHPDPRWGTTDCRVVDETPARLEAKGYTRLTLVLRENRSATPGVRQGKTRLRAVSGG